MAKSTLPPKIPGQAETLQRAISLLGHLTKVGELRESRRNELIELIGACPSPKVAADWKQVLKEYSKR
ncbi:MAG: hypothetical protein F6K24_31325, partial [Okeania sp. SIO2D1]|nr:hypothetical protein [Okeania sp. SIO2D1]